jgi:hypothetical protein
MEALGTRLESGQRQNFVATFVKNGFAGRKKSK